MSEIPDDIMQAATEIVERIAKQHVWKGDCVADVAQAILSERHRHAEVMEEVRKVLREAVSTLECYADPSGYADGFDEPYGSEETHPGLLAESTLKAVRALLSRLEGK